MVRIPISKVRKTAPESGAQVSSQEEEVEKKPETDKTTNREDEARTETTEAVDLNAAEATAAAENETDETDAKPSSEQELEDLRRENRVLREQVLRVRAEAENFRKRLQREKDDFVRFAREGFIRELLPVKDNLERALAHAEQEPAGIVDGVRMTLEQFSSIFKNMGVEPVECVGQPFDPARHEAMTQVESSEHEPNCVVDELQKGYTLHGRLLRPAMVSVAKEPVAKNGEK